jgi:hypothetical protein
LISFDEFGDGREERMAATELALRLMRNPKVAARRKEYNRKLESSRQDARNMLSCQIIDRLIEHNPSYRRHLLEKNDHEQLVERYARTFYKEK